MNVAELKDALDKLGVPHRFYSIDGDLTGDTHIFNHVHTYWEYFYFDEKGCETGYKRFENEHDACIYFYQTLANEMNYHRPSSRCPQEKIYQGDGLNLHTRRTNHSVFYVDPRGNVSQHLQDAYTKQQEEG